MVLLTSDYFYYIHPLSSAVTVSMTQFFASETFSPISHFYSPQPQTTFEASVNLEKLLNISSAPLYNLVNSLSLSNPIPSLFFVKV